MKVKPNYAESFKEEIKLFIKGPWTLWRFFGLLLKVVLTLAFTAILLLAVMVVIAVTSPTERPPTPDERIQAYCDATAEIRVEIQFKTELWMLQNHPEAPHHIQGWGNGLTEKQKIAFLKISRGVSPGCPWPPGQ